MPTPDMLKKLLDEFDEKEAHNREEINAINEQIAELERRIISSRRKLESVGTDREKVRQMLSRYTNRDWQSMNSLAPGASYSSNRMSQGATSEHPSAAAPPAAPPEQNQCADAAPVD
jgi:hypothetical protein